MIYKKYLITIVILNFFLLGCSNLKEKNLDNSSPNEIYINAQKKLQNGNWKQAINQLEKLDSHYLFGPCSQQIKLSLIYAYYKNSDLLLAKKSIDHFIYLYPTHPNIDYVIYMRGLTNMKLDGNILKIFFILDCSERNTEYAKSAFKDFSDLIHRYPNSQYSIDARKRLFFLKERLARYEYSIANHYAQRGAWIAVINRIKEMLQDYPDTKATWESLKLMENAYRQLKMIAQANKVSKIITFNNGIKSN